MSRIAFDCAKCGNNIQLVEQIYNDFYKGHTLCMSCRPAEKADDYILVKLQMVADEKLGECGFKDDLQLAIDEIRRMRRDYASLLSANAELSFNNMTAKAKVKEYYRGLKENVGRSGLTENDVYHTTQAIENVLHAFNIKIEGVNA